MARVTKKDPKLGDPAQMYLEPPNAIERIGRGMADMYEPAKSLYYGLLGRPGQQEQYDAQRKQEEALYLRGLLGAGIPEQLRGAVPDVWRAVGQSAPFFALGPAGGLSGLTRQGIAKAAGNTLGWATFGQPATYAPELWDYFNQP